MSEQNPTHEEQIRWCYMKDDERVDPATGVTYTHVDAPDYTGTFRFMGGSRNEIIPDPESDALIGRGAWTDSSAISVHVEDFRYLTRRVTSAGCTWNDHRAPKYVDAFERPAALAQLNGKRVLFKFRRTNGERIAFDVRAL